MSSSLSLAEMVNAGGGKYVGIQEALNGNYFIMFNTQSGSTLAIRACDITVEAVRNRIEKYTSKSGEIKCK